MNKVSEEKAVQLAIENFWKGFHCSEAVLIAMAEYMGVTSDLIPRVATGFGGGIAGSGSVCGALIGGVMAIGIKHGRNKVTQTEADQKTKSLARKFIREFKKIAGSTFCYDITRCDFNTLEGKKKFVEDGVRRKCQNLAGETVSALISLMKDNDCVVLEKE